MDSIAIRLHRFNLVRFPAATLFLVVLLAGVLTLRPAVASDNYQKNRGSTLPQNSVLSEREAMVSPQGDFMLITQADGNLCVSHQQNGAGIWCSRDTVAPGHNFQTSIQSDGNLCTFGSEGVVWCLNDSAQDGGPFFLALQDDANLCMYKGTPSTITGAVWCSMALAKPLPHGSPLIYGSTYHIKNNYSGKPNTYLDTRFSGCNGNWLCVSTAYPTIFDQNSGSWILLSAQGKSAGSAVKEGDLVYLANKYPYGSWGELITEPFGGFLDLRDSGCQGNVSCVSTSAGPRRDGLSGTWKIEANGEAMYSDQDLHLRNQYNGTYLDTRNPGCLSNILCVSTSLSRNRDSGSGTWRFELANDVSDDALLERIRYYVENYSPRVRLHPDDPYLPESAEYYLSKSAMYAANIPDENSAADIARPAISYTADEVAQLGVNAAESELRKRLANSSPTTTKVWLSPEKDKDQVKLGSLDRAKTYVTVNKINDVFTIKYWYFFGYNGAGRIEACSSSSVCITKQASSYGRHDGDWEHAEMDVSERGEIRAVRLSAHGNLAPVEIEHWQGNHPVIYAAFYSHALYPSPGQHNYQRIASKNWGLGTASIDLFDRAGEAGRTLQITGASSYELVAISGMKDITKGTDVFLKPSGLFSFGGRWGRYEHVKESIDILPSIFSVTVLEEIGAGPNTPNFK